VARKLEKAKRGGKKSQEGVESEEGDFWGLVGKNRCSQCRYSRKVGNLRSLGQEKKIDIKIPPSGTGKGETTPCLRIVKEGAFFAS